MQFEVTTPTISAPEIRRELNEILASQTFRSSPKLSRLLSYVCEKAMLDQADQVTEYTIGVDVFSKPENFKESKDSNVRVEVHRLRKRLAQFYETEGSERPIRMVIAPGRYTPEFVLAGAAGQSVEAAAEPTVEFPLAPVTIPEPVSIPELRRHVWLAMAGAIVVAAALAGVFAMKRSLQPKVANQSETNAPAATAAVVASAAGFSALPLRMMAGYEGPPHTDGSGSSWRPDQYFQGGRSSRRSEARTVRTNNPFLFQYSRIGDFSYAIPLPPGVYELHLYFIESEYGPDFNNGENDRTFFLHINDWRVTPEIDIESDTMGPNIADERVFKDVQPGPDGKLHLEFESGKGVPLLNAIEILPGTPHRQLPIRLVVQPESFTTHDGVRWRPDNFHMNGRVVPRGLMATGTPDPGLYAVERFGHFTYSIPVDVRSRYAVKLHFAEMYFGTSSMPTGGVGSRVFNVICNGVTLLENFDIFKEAGAGRAIVKMFHHLKPNAQGKLNLTFEPVINYGVVSAIEVIDESE